MPVRREEKELQNSGVVRFWEQSIEDWNSALLRRNLVFQRPIVLVVFCYSPAGGPRSLERPSF